MPLFLNKRNEQLTELMDQPDCDKHLLFNTYQQFTSINKLLPAGSASIRSLSVPFFPIRPKNIQFWTLVAAAATS
jgi:hypothetical protein